MNAPGPESLDWPWGQDLDSICLPTLIAIFGITTLAVIRRPAVTRLIQVAITGNLL